MTTFFTKREPCTKFCGILISFHEVIKLLKWDHTRECMKYFTSPLFFYMFLLILLERTFWCFDHFWRTYRVKVTSSKQVNINNMLIVVSKQTFWEFSLMPFCFMMKSIIFSESCYFDLRPPLVNSNVLHSTLKLNDFSFICYSFTLMNTRLMPNRMF